MSLPNLFLAAAPRAGSTQLAHWLSSHQLIALSPIKEPNYFSAHEFPEEFVRATHLDDIDPRRIGSGRPMSPSQFAVVRSRSAYAHLFDGVTKPWRLDASTTYLACPEAPAAIRAACPTARIITLTRDPEARSLSHYRLALRTGRTTRPLGAELADELAGRTPLPARFLVRPSHQAAGVARIETLFGADHLALQFETMVADPATALCRVARFLGIDPDGFDLRVEARNAGVAPRFPALNRVLYKSGLKTRLRRVVPAAIKTRLKPIYFSSKPGIAIARQDRDALADALTGVS